MTAFNEASPLEVVDIADESARGDTQIGADGLLALPGLCGDGTDDSGLCRRQLDAGQLLGHQSGGVITQLRQQYADVTSLSGVQPLQQHSHMLASRRGTKRRFVNTLPTLGCVHPTQCTSV